MRRFAPLLVLLCLLAAGCGGKKELIKLRTTVTQPTTTVQTVLPTTGGTHNPGIPVVATKNTTRVGGGDPVTDAAGVALAVYPSAIAGTHPPAVVLAPTDDWEAALAASVLMASPVHAPLLLSGSKSLPSVTATALKGMAPTGAGSLSGAQVIRVGDVATVGKLHSASIGGSDPYTLAAGIDRLQSAAAGRPSSQVVVASSDSPAYAMPAAGWAAESGDPILFVAHSQIPTVTRSALTAHGHPNIYVLGPPSVISDSLVKQLGTYGTVKRVGAQDPAANSVAFAGYRDPPCPYGKPCVHVPGSFGWALRSPGHGYTLVNATRPLDAAAAAALSASGSFGPEIVLDQATKLPSSVVNFFLDYATPGYTQEGPTAAVYNHGWLIGDQNAVSVGVQAEVDSLLQAIPQQP